jgi:hypothetical protein
MVFRHPTVLERRLLRAVFAHASGVVADPDWAERIRVRTKEPDSAGSLLLHLVDDLLPADRYLGRCVAELRFRDADSVQGFVALHLDQFELPYELDLWKVDFTELVEVPEAFLPAPDWIRTERVLDPAPRLRGTRHVERSLARIARRNLDLGETAQVTLRLFIEPDGRTSCLRVIESSGDPQIDQDVRNMLGQARFYPGMYRSRPMRALVEMSPKLWRGKPT